MDEDRENVAMRHEAKSPKRRIPQRSLSSNRPRRYYQKTYKDHKQTRTLYIFVCFIEYVDASQQQQKTSMGRLVEVCSLRPSVIGPHPETLVYCTLSFWGIVVVVLYASGWFSSMNRSISSF